MLFREGGGVCPGVDGSWERVLQVPLTGNRPTLRLHAQVIGISKKPLYLNIALQLARLHPAVMIKG